MIFNQNTTETETIQMIEIIFGENIIINCY